MPEFFKDDSRFFTVTDDSQDKFLPARTLQWVICHRIVSADKDFPERVAKTALDQLPGDPHAVSGRGACIGKGDRLAGEDQCPYSVENDGLRCGSSCSQAFLPIQCRTFAAGYRTTSLFPGASLLASDGATGETASIPSP